MASLRHATLTATPVPLHLSVNVPDDWIEGVEFGAVMDGLPASHLVTLSDSARYVLNEPGGTARGFGLQGYASADLDALRLFDGPRFRVPLLGLDDASVGEIVLAARNRFQVSTADVCFFQLALSCGEDEQELEAATGHWLSCAEAGDMRGLFGLGYTLFDLDRHHEAYAHLRRYSELAPHNSWAWLWLGRAAEALSEDGEAAFAYRSAIRCQQEGSFRTDAATRLQSLERRARAGQPR